MMENPKKKNSWDIPRKFRTIGVSLLTVIRASFAACCAFLRAFGTKIRSLFSPEKYNGSQTSTSSESSAPPSDPAAPPERARHAEHHKPKKAQTEAWVRFRAELPGRLRALASRALTWLKANFAVSPRAALRMAAEGIVLENPVLILTMGLVPALGVTNSLQGAVTLGLTALAVLLCSNLIVSLVRQPLARLSEGIRTLAYVLLAALLSGIADAIVTSFFAAPPASAFLSPSPAALWVFIPLLAVNGLLLTRAKRAGEGQTPGYALADALFSGIGYALVLIALAVLREGLGNGTLWGISLFGDRFQPLRLLAEPAGGMMLLGALIAAAQTLKSRAVKQPKPVAAQEPDKADIPAVPPLENTDFDNGGGDEPTAEPTAEEEVAP